MFTTGPVSSSETCCWSYELWKMTFLTVGSADPRLAVSITPTPSLGLSPEASPRPLDHRYACLWAEIAMDWGSEHHPLKLTDHELPTHISCDQGEIFFPVQA